MILDSSALVAVVRGEQDSQRLLSLIATAPSRRISAANLLESYMVVDRSSRLEDAIDVDEFLVRARVRVEPVTHDQVILARSAFHRYGKGSGHPARLNFGDCFAYALARYHDEPLLFIGRDFAATDIEAALPT